MDYCHHRGARTFAAHRVVVGVAVLSEPQSQELLVYILQQPMLEGLSSARALDKQPLSPKGSRAHATGSQCWLGLGVPHCCRGSRHWSHAHFAKVAAGCACALLISILQATRCAKCTNTLASAAWRSSAYLWLLPCSMPLLICLGQPVPAAVWGMDLIYQQDVPCKETPCL